MNPKDKTVAIIGASKNRNKYGNKAVRAYADQGFVVYPVNPTEDAIEGLKCYPSITEIPGDIETVSVYLPPERALDVLEGIQQKSPDVVFLNPGSESEEVSKRAEELGINAVQACSIVAVGKMPGEYDEESDDV